MTNQTAKSTRPKLFNILKDYRWSIGLLIFLALLSNTLTLFLPKLIASSIDIYIHQGVILNKTVWQFVLLTLGIFIFTYIQNIVQVLTSEKVARDYRNNLAYKISKQSYYYIQKTSSAKLLTTLTSDTDAIKMFISQAVVSLVSSAVIIVGVSILLLSLDLKLALIILLIIPLIGGVFFFVLSRVRPYFFKVRSVIDWLNKVINESILGASLIRVLNSGQIESQKFDQANSQARDLGLTILQYFAALIPIITFVANLSMFAILALGGKFVITGTLSLGNFTAFISYVTMLIFPILVIGFMSNIIAQANVSFARIREVLDYPDPESNGKLNQKITGQITLENVHLSFGENPILENINLNFKPRSKTAIIGPTAAGKTELLYLLIGLVPPTQGKILYDGVSITEYDLDSLHAQVGFVFQDSIIFNMSIKENITFGGEASIEALEKAITTAELKDFIAGLPDGLETIVSERGGTLSGGQKQRIMLARALVLNPKVLLLDDFTARVDSQTEQKILKNISQNYPDCTLISVTQKIASIEHYNQIIVLMEGELIAQGTHDELLHNSPEYIQIYNSQKSTNQYELQS